MPHDQWPVMMSRAQVRRLDACAVENYGMAGIVLMENAGRAVTDALCRIGVHGPVVICCGSGNNAGDGFVIARHLELRGYQVRTVLAGPIDKLPPDAAGNYHLLCLTGHIPQPLARDLSPRTLEAILADADWIVDALLGTGAVGAPRPPLDQLIRRLNQSPAKRLAVDLPSGLDADTGEVPGVAIRADHTCTLAALKPGLLVAAAEPYVGQLQVVDIGVPRCVFHDVLAEPADA